MPILEFFFLQCKNKRKKFRVFHGKPSPRLYGYGCQTSRWSQVVRGPRFLITTVMLNGWKVPEDDNSMRFVRSTVRGGSLQSGRSATRAKQELVLNANNAHPLLISLAPNPLNPVSIWQCCCQASLNCVVLFDIKEMNPKRQRCSFDRLWKPTDIQDPTAV